MASAASELRQAYQDGELGFKKDALGLARSQTIERQKRMEAREIAQWLTVWLQSPDIFEDWLSLRQRSPEFIQLTS